MTTLTTIRRANTFRPSSTNHALLSFSTVNSSTRFCNKQESKRCIPPGSTYILRRRSLLPERRAVSRCTNTFNCIRAYSESMEFPEQTSQCCTALGADVLHQISYKSGKWCEKYRHSRLHAFVPCTFTVLIFTKLIISQHIFSVSPLTNFV